MLRSSNPALSNNIFQSLPVTTTDKMTLQGTVNKTGLLLLFILFTATFTWQQYTLGASTTGWMALGGIGGFIAALITVFKKHLAPITAPIYALCEGLFLGSISALFEARYPGIVIQAVFLTFGTLFSLLAAYRSGLINVTENFKLGVTAATGGIFVFYMLSFVLGFFGIQFSPIYGGGLIGIGFSLVVVVIAALNLVMDFDFIETGVEQGAPKYMEWYGAFGLTVTLVWLYIEMLRLLSKLRDRR